MIGIVCGSGNCAPNKHTHGIGDIGMDYDFRNSETSTTDAERKYDAWLLKVGKLLNREIDGGTDTENEVSDYYFAGMSPEEAAVECLAQEEIDAKKSGEPKTLTIINRHGVETNIKKGSCR